MKGRKPVNPEGKAQVHTKLDPDAHKFVRDLAEREGLHVWRVIADAVDHYKAVKQAETSNDRSRVPVAS